jgi:hypothetical protein
MFEFTTWHASFLDFLTSLRHYTVIGNQLFISNDRNRVRCVVLGLLQYGACTDFFENLRETYRMLPLSNHLFSHWSIPLTVLLVLFLLLVFTSVADIFPVVGFAAGFPAVAGVPTVVDAPCCCWHPAIFGIPTVDDGVPAVAEVYFCYLAYRIIMFCLPVPTTLICL